MRDFEKIYAEYFSEVYKFALTLCRSPSLAEEITQESFFKALKSIDRFEGNCSLSSWLCQIVKNTYYSFAKKQGRQTDSLPQLLPSPERLEDRFLDRESAQAIYQALHRLKEPYKEVFCLRCLGELSFAQIAALFDKSETWARVTYHRAKIKIQEELE